MRQTPDTEHAHQVALFAWAKLQYRAYPELRWLYATPNGGARNPITAAKLQREGVRRGVPDLYLPVPRRGYHGLWIELKRPGRHAVSPEQREWIAGLNGHGYRAVVCVGWEAARAEIEAYLRPEHAQD